MTETPVFVPCWKCGGTGNLPWFAHSWNGVCLACNGTKGRWSTVEREKRNAKVRARRAAKRAERGAAEAAEREAARRERVEAAHTEALALDAEETAKAEARAAIVLPNGRVEIVGRITSMAFRESDFGGAWKMLVESDEGWRVWGSVPGPLMEVEEVSAHYREDRFAWGSVGAAAKEILIGRRVRFTATVKPSDRDHTFGFFSRPTKSTLLPEEK